MCLEEHIYWARKEGFQEGFQIGFKIGSKIRTAEIKNNIEICREFGKSDDEIAARLKRDFNMGEEAARQYITQYKS